MLLEKEVIMVYKERTFRKSSLDVVNKVEMGKKRKGSEGAFSFSNLHRYKYGIIKRTNS